MSNVNNLRPVLVTENGKKTKGFFHRFVYRLANNYSETLVLVELMDGRLRYFDPFFVQFLDRTDSKGKENTLD